MATDKKGQIQDDKDPLEMSDEELEKFFKEELAKIPSPEEPDLVEPASATGGEPAKVEDILDTKPPGPEGEPKEKEPTEDPTAEFKKLVPETFQSEDFATSLKKMTSEWDDMQSRLSKREKDVERLNKAMRAAQAAKPARPAPARPSPEDQARYMVPKYGQPEAGTYQQEMTARPDPIEEPESYQQWMDSRYLQMGQQMMYDFANNLQKVWDHNQAVNTATIDKQRILQDEFSSFRRTKEDFDDYRDDMVNVIEEHPYLNEQPGAIETVYDMAKERHTQRLGKLKEGVKPEGYDDLKKAIVVIGREMQNINKKAADERLRVAKQTASGTGGSTGTVRTKERLSPEEQQNLSEDDKLWETILTSQLGGLTNEGDSAAADLLNLERFAKPIKGEL